MPRPSAESGVAVENTDANRWADPRSLLGLLQRGRGDGFLEALGHPDEAVDLVVDCVTRDPRLDHQVESRGWFYAALVEELDIDLPSLRAAFAKPAAETGDDAAWLATSVFELVARRGVPGGVSELRRYLRSGRDVDLALEHLLPLADHPEAVGLLDDILESADTEQLREALSWMAADFTVAPWPTWRRVSTQVDHLVGEVISQRGRRTDSAPPAALRSQRAMFTRDLLIRTGREAEAGTPQAELIRLADDGGEDMLLDVAPALLGDESLKVGVKAAVRRTLWGLRSPKALAWARTTASLDDEGGLAAVHLLAELAEATDLPRVRSLLEAAVAGGNDYMYAQCALVDGIGRLSDQASLGLIKTLFDETVYSYLRRRCVRALSLIEENFATTRAPECLYDCEAETRAIAIEAVDMDSPDIRERLAQVAGDPTEDESCRQAAVRVAHLWSEKN